MAKLYFRYGTVNSAKSMNLLSVAHNYKTQGKNILVMKPKIDTRTEHFIYSRVGIKLSADYLIDEKTDLISIVSDYINPKNNNKESKNDSVLQSKPLHCILVDEAQFLTRDNIMEFRFISTYLDVPVICYGLRTNYKGELFEGSNALFSLADSLEEIKNTCQYCNKKGSFNLKIKNNSNTNEIELGFEDVFVSACYKHYFSYVET